MGPVISKPVVVSIFLLEKSQTSNSCYSYVVVVRKSAAVQVSFEIFDGTM